MERAFSSIPGWTCQISDGGGGGGGGYSGGGGGGGGDGRGSFSGATAEA